MDINYKFQEVSPIADVSDFSKSGIKSAKTVEKLFSQISQVLVIPKKNINVYAVGEHAEGFRFDAYSTDQRLVAQFYYIPGKKIFDIYDSSGEFPMIGWRGKVLKIKNYSSLLDKLHVEKLFNSLLALT